MKIEKNGKIYHTKTVREGRNFAVVGVVCAGNHREIWRGPPRPLGCERAAHDDALRFVRKIGAGQ